MTQIEIPEKRRSEIKQAVIKALENGSIFYLPLKIKAIVRSFSNIRLIPFSKHMKKQGYLEVIYQMKLTICLKLKLIISLN